MKEVLLFVWNTCLFLGAVASESNLEINTFDVGCGNFVLLRKDDEVLIIDCGGATAFDRSSDKNRLKDILKGSKNCTVVITHNHEDHHSASGVLWSCFPEVYRGNMKFFYGWFPSAKERREEVMLHGNIRCVPLCDYQNALDGCLGMGVSIHHIIPKNIEEETYPHINNLVVGIKYGNISFIFPGDANQDWFSENCEELKKLAIDQLGWVNFLLIPHHGNMSDTGFFMKDAIENFTKNTLAPNQGRKLMCVISSKPEQRYRMPRQGVQYLFSHNNMLSKVKSHRLSLAKVNQNNTKQWETVVAENIMAPVFSTVDSVYGYKIVCDGTDFWMYNALGIPRRQEEGIAELKVFDSAGLAMSR
jgi:hypothetical protein